jgi:hypothetical protein
MTQHQAAPEVGDSTFWAGHHWKSSAIVMVEVGSFWWYKSKRVVFPSGNQVMYGLTIGAWIIQ